jgi:hypothetical protein
MLNLYTLIVRGRTDGGGLTSFARQTDIAVLTHGVFRQA